MTYTPIEQLSTKKKILSDGTIQIGEQFIDPQKRGEAQVGRGDAGVGTGAGSNIFKANAIEEIYKRGIGADGNYDIGLLGQATGVTQQDIDNYHKTVTQRRLAREFDGRLEAAGARKVQWGDDAYTVQNLLAKAQEAKKLKKTEPGRLNKEQAQAIARTNQENRNIRSENTANQRYALESERLWQEKQENRKERALTREMNAENNRMQMQLEYSRLAQQDRQNAQDRKDKAIMMLMQGLGNLGTAFTI